MRVSRTVLREAEGVTPSAYSPSRNSCKGPEDRCCLERLKKPGMMVWTHSTPLIGFAMSHNELLQVH